ncbi:MAG TPA: OB-fold domain-containing protein [Pseudomonas sp.]
MSDLMQTNLAGGHLLRAGAQGPILLGSRCRQCGECYFPIADNCTRCSATEFERCEIGRQGRLWSWTIQGFLPKAPYNSGESEVDFQPYGVGYVEMPCGVKVESRLTVADPQQLHIGMPMELTLVRYGRNAVGEPLHTFAFAPLAAEGDE